MSKNVQPILYFEAAEKYPPPLEAVDADTLLSTPLEPLRFAIEELLPQGLHILAGSPKVGKSWLVLWLCLMVAKGESVWTLRTNQSDVLYLSLEDSYQRIQARLFQITDTAPETLYFSNASCGLEDGLPEQIDQFMKEHPCTRLIAIDTLQRVRRNTQEGNIYASDYKDISALKMLADKHRISILLVHHLRKMKDADPFNQVSGSSGLIGATDGNFVLKKDQREGKSAKLIVSGRDIEYQELLLDFELPFWKLVAHNKGDNLLKEKIHPIIAKVCTFIETHGDFCGTASELLRAMNESEIQANYLSKLLNQNRVSLEEKSITYSYKKTNTRKIIKLSIQSDGVVDGDGDSTLVTMDSSTTSSREET